MQKALVLFCFLFSAFFSQVFCAPPVVNITPKDNIYFTVWTPYVFTANASDPDNDPISFEWSYNSEPPGLSLQLTVTEETYTYSKVNCTGPEGRYQLSIKADDVDGNASTYATDIVTFQIINSEIFYVSVNGSDNTSREEISDTKPLKTIQKALDYAGPGDQIILLPSSIGSPLPTTFSAANLTFSDSGTLTNPITVRTREQDRGLITIVPFSGNIAFELNQRKHIKIQGLNFRNFAITALDITDSTDIEIEHCHFEDNAVGIRLDRAEMILITDNFFRTNEIGVEFLLQVKNNLIDHNRFSRNMRYGIHMNNSATCTGNAILRSTFYRNGTVYDDFTQHAAVNIRNNPNNTLQYLIFSNNIKDFYSAIFTTSQLTIFKIISHANIDIEKDTSFVQFISDEDWLLTDPLLKAPETDDFDLIEGSPASLPGEESNIGWYQGTPKSKPSTKTIYVDHDTANSAWSQNGQKAYPFSTINQALQKAEPGDTIYVVKGAMEYNADLALLKPAQPGLGQIKIIGISKTNTANEQMPPIITCISNTSNALNLIDKAFLHIENFMIRDKSTENNCRKTGINIDNSRHISFKHIFVQQQDVQGFRIDSAQRITITSSIIYDNTTGIQTDNSKARNQWNKYDKLAVVNNLTNGIQLQNVWKSTITNSIFSENPTCVSSSVGIVSNFSIQWSFCRQPGITSNDPLWKDGNNILGVDPLFRSNDQTARRNNPYSAFLLSVTNNNISPCLNNGQPNYPDGTPLPEFPSEINWSKGQTKTVSGIIDIGAFEQSKTDVDGDGLHNRTEQEYSLDPNNSLDALEDPDNDELSSYNEIIKYGTDPTNPDTDGDGYSDGIEVSIGSDPLVPNADYIQALVPRPQILPHISEMVPTRFQLNGVEKNSRGVINQWVLVSAPTGVLEEDIFINNTGFGLDVVAKKSGNYVIGLDQTITGGVEGSGLKSLPEHRAITTITILDVPPTPVLPADTSVTWQAGKVIYFYGSDAINTNPSFDLNGDPIQNYEWIPVAPQNPNLGIFDYNNPIPYLEPPNRTAVYAFQLAVSSFGENGYQTKISTDVFRIFVTGGAEGSLPMANAGPNSYGQIGQILTLNGRGSGDEDNVPLEYYWRQTAGPEVQFVTPSLQPLSIFEPAANITITTQATVGLNPQFMPGNVGAVEFELVVSKEVRSSGVFRKIYSWPDRVWYIIDSDSNAVPTALISNIGYCNVNATATISGAGSRDRIAVGNLGSASPISFQWQQIAGPVLQLKNTDQSSLTFTPVEMGFYTFSLVVTDQTGVASMPDYKTIAVAAPDFKLPEAHIVEPSSSKINRTIMLNGSSSTGGHLTINGSTQHFPILAWHWKQVNGPELVKLIGSSNANVSFRPTKSGNYSFELKVANNQYISPPAQVSISIDSDAQSIPVAGTRGKTVFNLQETVILDGSASYSDDPISYFWRQLSGEVVSLSSQTESIVSFQPTTTGIYKFELVVYDGRTESLPKYVTISVVDNSNTDINFSQQNPFSFDPTTILPDSSSDCFIISASFGQNSRTVRLLSKFRDNVLLKSHLGKKLVAWYYKLSPKPAKIIAQHQYLRFLVRFLCFCFFLLPPMLFVFLIAKIKGFSES